MAGSRWQFFFPAMALVGLTPAPAAAGGDGAKYMIASFPQLQQLQYVNVPDWNWRPLVVTGLGEPKAIAVDLTNFRLFVADHTVPAILWYQLQKLPNGKLITDGHQHLAVADMTCHNMAVDGTGNLFYTGKWTPKMPQAVPPQDSIFKHTAIQIATGDTAYAPAVWDRSNTGVTTPKAWVPGGIALDAFNMYWANSDAGTKHGAIIRGGQEAPDIQPELSVTQIADNSDQVFSVCLTTTFLFYSTPEGIYGISKTKATDVCTEDSCKLISAVSTEATAMTWDGDGTIFVADHKQSKIFSFPSGSAELHKLEPVVDAPNIYSAAMMILSLSHARATSFTVPLLSVLVAIVLTLQRD